MAHMPDLIDRLARSQDGAVLPLVAMSIIGLVSVGALAFDYSRLVTLDTELQNAADHAALAAATQLDDSGSCDAPTAAASELVANETRFATDGAGPIVTIQSVVCADDMVTVTVTARTVDYAITPVYALVADDVQGTTLARASARLASAICKVPPLMMCNPAELAGGAFYVGNYVGKGILAKAGGGGSWVPGNFGFLEVGASPSASNIRDVFGRTSTNFECVAETGVTTAPGNMSTVSTAINTRFDIYESGWGANCGGIDCPSALNTSKDVVKAGGACTLSNGGWRQVAATDQYAPNAATRTDDDGVTSMGHPRDICHAVSVDGDCPEARIGDGNWDRAKYFEINHPTVPTATWQSALGTTPTRYQTYLWELGHLEQRPIPGTSWTSHKAPICSAGVGPSASTVDRRKASVAVINCIEQSVNGHSVNVETEAWIDVFLVEPSIDRITNRTSKDEIYIEVIGETENAGNGAQAQLVRRDVPYLVR